MSKRRVDPVLDLPLIRQLVSLAHSIGYSVERNDQEVPPLGGGACIYVERRICISTRFGELDALPVLLHELAHALLHDAPGRELDDRAVHEHEVNWVRSQVLSQLGLVRLLPPEGIVTGPPPSDETAHAVEEIIACMPLRVTKVHAHRSELPVADYGLPAPDDVVKEIVLEAALILGFQVFWISGRQGIAGEHRAGALAITVSDELSEASEVAVLAHEVAHAVQHPPGATYGPPSTEERDDTERVAHAAATNLLRRFGLTDYSTRLEAIGGHPTGGATEEDLQEGKVIADIIERAGTMYPLSRT